MGQENIIIKIKLGKVVFILRGAWGVGGVPH